MKNKPNGFTLIEVLIVIAITVALATIGATMAKSSKAKAQRVITLEKMKSLETEAGCRGAQIS